MSLLARINNDTIPKSFTINGHVEQQREFMGTYNLQDEKKNNEYIYKKNDKDYYFYHSNTDNYWLFCYSKNDIDDNLGGIRVNLNKNPDIKKDNLDVDYKLSFDCYTYNNDWIVDNKINLQILKDLTITLK